MKKRNEFKLYFVIILFIGSIGFSSCENQEDNTPPEIPDLSTFSMDFSDFSNSKKSEISNLTSINWSFSALNVAVWNSLLTINLAIPVASFVESFNHEAVYHPDENNFTWSYNFIVLFNPFEAELTGEIIGDSVFWAMNITKGTEYSDFTWYTGASHKNRSGGYWILNENPQNGSPFIKIDWESNAAGETGSMKYTNIKPGAAENGAYIHYGLVENDLDAFYHIYNKIENNLTEIEWNRSLKNGRVKSPNAYQNSDWHCWDTQLNDVICN